MRFFKPAIFLLLSISLHANAADTNKTDEESEDAPSLSTYVEGMEKKEGIFTTYQDPESGSLHLSIDKAQLNEEYLYFSVVHNGLLDAGLFRGAPLAEDVIEIRRYFNRIDFIKKNTNFLVSPDSPLANESSANVSDALLATAEIVAISEDENTMLINADALFLKEILSQVSANLDPDTPPHEQFDLGSLAEDRTKYAHVGVYPENMNVRTDFVYENPKPFMSAGDTQASPRATTITVEHSFLLMPDNDFVPRVSDQRVGYFTANKTDLNSFDLMPYQDYINRWHLVKKDPNAAISEPVEPIVWWIENTTPLEYRDIMKKGVLAWNSAFEKAGFKNAIQVKIQPDDANWHPEDIRYNVIRWSHTPGAGFAFGPNHVNPRTGQVLGGDVMFEHFFLVLYGFDGDVLADPNAFIQHYIQHDTKPKTGPIAHHAKLCSRGFQMREMANFGRLALEAMDASVSEKRKIIEQMLMELMLHEVGHVLGLAHNMKASNYWSLDDVLNPERTQGNITASVMDYAALVVAKPGQPQGDYFSVAPGPYDDWAIQFGYDPAIEGEAREALLARSSEPELDFGNDADDMRSPGVGIDPRVNVWDMSKEPIAFAKYQFELIDEITPKLKSKLQNEGDTWAKIRLAMTTLITQKYSGSASVASFIGGVEVNRFVQGQKSDAPPYKPVDKATQKQAMNVLSEHIFAPDAFSLPQDLLQHSAMQARGFDHYGRTEDPKLHELILGVQKVALARLLNPTVLTRISDTQLYGNEYSVEQVLTDLSDAVFLEDIKSQVNNQRRLLQGEYVLQLLAIVQSGEYDGISKASAYGQLKRIEDWVSSGRVRNTETKAHRQYLAYLIKSSLDERG